jgi:hypothetical protein
LTAGCGQYHAATHHHLLGSAEGRSPFLQLLFITVVTG